MFSSVQEADYEIASYARQHGSLGILGQDSDFIIYDRFVHIIMLYFKTVLDVKKKMFFESLLLLLMPRNDLHHC